MKRNVVKCVWGAVALVVTAGTVACERGGEIEAPSQGSSRAEAEEPTGSADQPDDRYRTRVMPETIAAESNNKVELALTPGQGLKVNKEYPNWKLRLQPPESLQLAEASFEARQFRLAESAARVATTIEASKPGTYQIPGTAEFSVCNDETCHVLRDESVTFRVQVESSEKTDDNPSKR